MNLGRRFRSGSLIVIYKGDSVRHLVLIGIEEVNLYLSNRNEIGIIGCPTSGAAQCAMREAAPHARGVSKARQL
jgi:hypothetical protein